MSQRDDDLLSLAHKRFAQASEADKKQRQRELEDLKFYAGEQWNPAVEIQRAGQNAQSGLPPVPARPCLTINKVRQPVQQVTNDIRDADFGVELVAADDFGELVGDSDETEIELREGLVRRIQRSSEAEDARLWAAIRAAICGRGFYSVMWRYLPGKTKWRELYIHRYYNQSSVSLDPAHEQPDGSDAEWGFEGTDLPWEQYQAEFPKAAKGKKNALLDASDEEFRALGDDYPGWFTLDQDTRSCRVVNYWYTERVARTLVEGVDGQVYWEDELPHSLKTIPDSERDVIQKKIKWAKLDGYQVLDETDWEGSDLPIVKVLGEELQPYDNERRAEGMVRPARDSQIGFNQMVSKWVEMIGLAPLQNIMLDPLSIEGYEQWYQLANTRTLPFLPKKSYDDQGRQFSPAERPPTNLDISAIGASVQMFDEAIQSTTGVPDSRVGRNTDSHLKSGKAIQALQQQSEHGTSNYRDNLKRSIRYEGQIINNLLYPIYGKDPGRMVKIVTGEGDSKTIRIGQPQQPGQPAPQTSPLSGMRQGQGQKSYTLTPDANFNVIVKVTKSFNSRREEETTIIGSLLQADPQLMGVYGDLFFKNQDGPGHDEMAERAKVMLAPPVQAYLAQKAQGTGDVPQAIQQQMAQKDQQIKHAEAVIAAMKQEIEGKTQAAQIDAENKIQLAQMAHDKDILLQQMKNAAAIEEARITAAKQAADANAEALEEQLALASQQAHESALSAQEHVQGLVAGQQAHDQALEQGTQGVQGQMAVQDNAPQPPTPQGSDQEPQ